MRQVRWASWTVAVAVVLLAGAPQATRADIASDKAAAIVVWPIVNVGGPFANDTLIQLSNTSTKQQEAHCFYVNANSHCTNTGAICSTGANCCDVLTGGCGLCLPSWQETDFRIILTARQPIGWEASDGLSQYCNNALLAIDEPCIPLDGSIRRGPPIDPAHPERGFQANAGTRIPPVPEIPFVGELKCVAVDINTGDPLSGALANVLKGEGTLEVANEARLDVGKYNAVGIQALSDYSDDGIPHVLTLQNYRPITDPPTPPAIGEYEGCPGVLILNHFFDFAVNPALPTRRVFTWPVFVPCTENFLQQTAGRAIAQYLVYNEFEQRFSTSNTVDCFRATGLSRIDTTDPARSIFNVGNMGTLTGQTRVTPIGSGLLAVALEFHSAAAGLVSPAAAPATALLTGQQADFNVHYQGQRPAADLITLP